MKYQNELKKISDKQYREVNALSKSALDDFHTSPKTYHLYHILKKEKKETEAILFGRALHSALLEPELYQKEYIDDSEMQGIAKRSKADKAAWEEFELRNKDKIILKASDANKILEITQAVKNHKAANNILEKSQKTEISAFWTQPDYQIPCKAKYDLLFNDDTIIDFKTTTASTPNAFGKSIINYRYHVQAAFYLDGLAEITGKPAKNFYIIACEKTRPYNVMVYKLTKEYLALGQKEYYSDLEGFSQCLKDQNFYIDLNEGEVMELLPPEWALQSLELPYSD